MGMEEDHPRSRGVYLHKATEDFINDGSSPLARGLLALRGDAGGGCRIIPARAGFTPYEWDVEVDRRDHPRSRGVYFLMGMEDSRAEGSSPLARGLPTKPDGKHR